MGSATEIQNQLRRFLSAYVNKGAFSRADLVLSVLFPYLVRGKLASRILHKHNEFTENIPSQSGNNKDVKIDIYKGNNPAALQMMAYLSKNMSDNIAGAYIHGSLGTGEEINYSDFDALVILKNSVFESWKKLMQVTDILRGSLQIMYDFDPLQHHGWFVLTEADLRYYDESYFPSILFEYSRSLLGETGRELRLVIRDSVGEEKRNFQSLAASVLSKLDRSGYPKNIYQLKSMLSEFMLLPAMFMQVSKGAGVFKKDSFQMAEVELVSQCWSSMRDVSSIRRNWEYDLSPSRRWLMTRVHPFRSHIVNKVAPGIPEAIAKRLDDELYSSMRCLIHDMQEHC